MIVDSVMVNIQWAEQENSRLNTGAPKALYLLSGRVKRKKCWIQVEPNRICALSQPNESIFLRVYMGGIGSSGSSEDSLFRTKLTLFSGCMISSPSWSISILANSFKASLISLEPCL